MECVFEELQANLVQVFYRTSMVLFFRLRNPYRSELDHHRNRQQWRRPPGSSLCVRYPRRYDRAHPTVCFYRCHWQFSFGN